MFAIHILPVLIGWYPHGMLTFTPNPACWVDLVTLLPFYSLFKSFSISTYQQVFSMCQLFTACCVDHMAPPLEPPWIRLRLVSGVSPRHQEMTRKVCDKWNTGLFYVGSGILKTMCFCFQLVQGTLCSWISLQDCLKASLGKVQLIQSWGLWVFVASSQILRDKVW